ncbi:MAG: TolC family protein [Hyphomicrobium sp.]
MAFIQGIRFLIVAYCLSLVGCSRQAEITTNSIPVLPEQAKSDLDLPNRPWLPEPLPLPGKLDQVPKEEKITLSKAVEKTIEYSPIVKVAFLEIEARRNEEAQASYRPNPDVSFTLENYGAKPSSDQEPENTLEITQVIELGNKRLARLRAAHLESSVAGWDFEAIRLSVAARAADMFVDVLASQKRIDVLENFTKIAKKSRDAIETQVKGGKASPIDLDRADIALSRAMALEEAEKVKLVALKKALSAMWGSNGQEKIGQAMGTFDGPLLVPSLSNLRQLLEKNPSLARWGDEIARRNAQLDLEQSKAVPNVTAGVGVRQFSWTDTAGVVASISVPLQIFDKNQGNIAAAEKRLQRSEFEASSAQNELTTVLIEILGELSVSVTQLKRLEDGILPSARSAYERTRIGYTQGRFDVLFLLDSQRTLLEAELDTVNARASYTKSKVKIEMLVGEKLSSLQ